MILECPACHARYLVQIGLFADGGRNVRCARCKFNWHARLPTTVDVFAPPPEPAAHQAAAYRPADGANLPAVIATRRLLPYLRVALLAVIALLAVAAWPVLDRQRIVRVLPELLPAYQVLGFDIDQRATGLTFDRIRSEIRYDGGIMRLYVDGFIHNNDGDIEFIPNIRAQALGPDRHVIQSWWVDAPAATVAPGGDVPFHTEINAPMKETIDQVKLEFFNQDEKANAGP